MYSTQGFLFTAGVCAGVTRSRAFTTARTRPEFVYFMYFRTFFITGPSAVTARAHPPPLPPPPVRCRRIFFWSCTSLCAVFEKNKQAKNRQDRKPSGAKIGTVSRGQYIRLPAANTEGSFVFVYMYFFAPPFLARKHDCTVCESAIFHRRRYMTSGREG